MNPLESFILKVCSSQDLLMNEIHQFGVQLRLYLLCMNMLTFLVIQCTKSEYSIFVIQVPLIVIEKLKENQNDSMIDKIRKLALKLISPNRNYVINSNNKSVRISSPFLIKVQRGLEINPLLRSGKLTSPIPLDRFANYTIAKKGHFPCAQYRISD